MNNLICLCGSLRFLSDFDVANLELSKRGLSVVTISVALPKDAEGNEQDAPFKTLLDLVHLHKILRSDAVLVVGDGYIGHSTAREILWAHMLGKPIVDRHAFATWKSVVDRLVAGDSSPNLVAKARWTLGLTER